jgi:hypothetical protein
MSNAEFLHAYTTPMVALSTANTVLFPHVMFLQGSSIHICAFPQSYLGKACVPMREENDICCGYAPTLCRVEMQKLRVSAFAEKQILDGSAISVTCRLPVQDVLSLHLEKNTTLLCYATTSKNRLVQDRANVHFC